MPLLRRARIAELEGALRDIADPLVAIRADAAAKGFRLNGAAVAALVEDAAWLRAKARAALATKPGGDR